MYVNVFDATCYDFFLGTLTVTLQMVRSPDLDQLPTASAWSFYLKAQLHLTLTSSTFQKYSLSLAVRAGFRTRVRVTSQDP